MPRRHYAVSLISIMREPLGAQLIEGGVFPCYNALAAYLPKLLKNT